MASKKEHLHLCRHGPLSYLMGFILLLGQFESPVEAKGSNYYTAAVFEHARYDDFSKSTAQEIILKNLDAYSTATKTAAKQGTDIIVFPEWGLYRHVKGNVSTILAFAEDIPYPSKKQYWNPCEDQSLFKDRPVLTHLSCMARDNALYLVANVADIKNRLPKNTCEMPHCSTDNKLCSQKDRRFYNTNVVFNRNGTLVSRYYKTHPYFSTEFSVADNPKPAYFETDFGLFTTFTCFDITFREAVEAVEKKHVLNVAFPTSWFDHLPLMAAVQYHQAWAMTNRVNLLAADVHRPGTGTIGSGIYSGAEGALVYTFNPDGESKLLISRVPTGKDLPEGFEAKARILRVGDGDVKDITDEEQDSEMPEQCSSKIVGPPGDLKKDYRCSELNTTDYTFRKLENTEGSLEVCEKGICCSLSYSADSMKEDFYLGVNNGVTWIYDTYGFGTETCLVIRCAMENGSEFCSTYPLISNTRFRNLKLSGNFSTKYVYPSVMKSKLRLAPTDEWEFRNADGQAQITYDPKSEKGEPILSVGLSGRCYDKDPAPRS